MAQPLKTWDALKALYKPDDTIGVILFSAKDQLHRPDPAAQQKIVTAEKAWSPDFQKYLRTQNARGYNVSIAANPLVANAKTRTKDNVREIRYLYLDLDTKNGLTGRQRLDAMLADPQCPVPRVVLHTSSENYQVLWQVTGFSRDQAEDTLKRLAAHYGGDLAIGGDVSRALRVPGLRNKKYAEHDPARPAPQTTNEADRTRLHGPTINGYVHSDRVHSADQFAYIPALQTRSVPALATPALGLTIEPHVAASTLPSGFDAPGRAVQSRTQPNTDGAKPTSGRDDSGSGKDWGHANYLFAKHLSSGRSLTDSAAEVRTYLIDSAAARGRQDGARYAETTLKKLMPTWELRQAEFQRPAAVPSSSVPPAPPKSEQAPSTPASGLPAPAPVPVPGIGLTALPPGFERTDEQRRHDAHFVLASLRDGQTPLQIRENMLTWQLRGIPGASDYVHGCIKAAETALESDRLITTAVDYVRNYGRGQEHDLGLFRTLLHQSPAGDGALSNVVECLSKADNFLPPSPSRPLPTEDHSAYLTAYQIAMLALSHGDTPRSIEAALTCRYHPGIATGTVAPDIQTIVHAAVLQHGQGQSSSNQDIPR